MIAFDLANKYLSFNDNITLKKKIKVNIDNQCQLRIWDKGNYGNTQCKNVSVNGCMCEKHIQAIKRMPNNIWWLGFIHEKRPEYPIHPISGKHQWKYDLNGNIINTNQNTSLHLNIKKQRGRPKKLN